MSLKFLAVAVLACATSQVLLAQCAENNYIHDGAPSSQLDCQPLAALKQVAADQMAELDRRLVTDRHADIAQAAHFYGFDLEDAGWTYQQALSPLLHKHVLLTFTNATPANRASHFTVIVPQSPNEKVQVIPAFSRGLRPYTLSYRAKGSYSVFNRLLRDERGEQPLSRNSDWIEYGVLYLTLVGGSPSVPTETDSLRANWDLSARGGTTPVIVVAKDGAAAIAFSDVAQDQGDQKQKTGSWRLEFDKEGQIVKAERTERKAAKVQTMLTENETSFQAEHH